MDNRFEELLKIKKKGDTSQKNKQLFSDLLTESLFKNGITKENVSLIEKGISFEGAHAFAMYLNNVETAMQLKTLKELLHTNVFKQNEKGITFKFLVSLLAEMINLKNETIDFMQYIINSIVVFSKNKDGQMWGDTNKIINKYFVCTLSKLSKPVNLEKLNIQQKNKEKFTTVIIDNVSKINSTSLDKNKQVVIKNIKEWLASTDTNQDSINKNTERSERSEKSQNITIKHNNKELNSIKTKCKILESENNKLENDNQKLKNDVGIFLKKQKLVEEENENLIKELHCLKQTIQIHQKEIVELKNTIQEQTKILNIFEINSKKEQESMLNAIAAKLKVEYQDYASIIDTPMSITLGENLRDQLQSIFNILEKNEIHIIKNEV